MTIETTLTKAQFLGNGSARAFPLPFPVLKPEHLRLIVTGTATNVDTPVTANFSVSGCGSSGVNVIYPVTGDALPQGTRLTIYRELPLVQELDLQNASPFDAEVIEAQFDAAAMQMQQLQEQIGRAVTMKISDTGTPEELCETLLSAAADAAASAAAGAASAAQSATDREAVFAGIAVAQDKAQEAAASANAAAASAAAAAQTAAQGQPDASESTKGITRYGTAEEHAAGAEGVAATPKHVRAMIASATPPAATETTLGTGRIATPDEAKNRKTNTTKPVPAFITPENMPDGLPLFALQPVPFSTVMPGNLSVCRDNGILTQGAFPEAYARLVTLQAAGETNIVSMPQYASEMTAQGGICARFALDTAPQTFRIPCAPGVFWRGVSSALSVGTWQPDQMRPITGRFTTRMEPSDNTFDGSFRKDSNASAVGSFTSSGGHIVSFDSSRLGVNFNGTDTHPLTAVCDWQIKMYGAVTDEGSVTLAQLIAAMTGKLDTSVYQADAWTRLKARVRVNRSGDIVASQNITSVSRVSAGIYRIFTPAASGEFTLAALPIYEGSGFTSPIGCREIIPRVYGQVTNAVIGGSFGYEDCAFELLIF